MGNFLRQENHSRLRQWAHAVWKDPQKYLSIFSISGLLVLFVIYPMIRVLLEPTTVEWANLFSQSRWIQVSKNTLQMTLLSTTTATLFGFIYAYAIERAQIPGSKFFSVVAILPLLSPPFLGSIAVIMLLGRQGLITNTLLGLDVRIYGLYGLWLVQTMGFFPMAYLTIRGVLKGINPNLEHAARDLGGSRLHIFRTIVVPLAMPGIISAALLTAIYVIGDFANPMVLGGRFRVLATEAYMQVQGWYNLRMAAAISIYLFAPTAVLFVLQRYLLRKGSYVTVSGKGGGSLGYIPVSRAVKALLFFLCGVMASAIIAIYAMIIYGAFTRVWGIDFSLSFANFRFAITQGRNIWNSVSFAAYAGLITAFLGVFTAFTLQRRKFFGQGILDFAVLLPAAIPGTLLGISYILAFNQPPLILTGTLFIVIVSMVFRAMPMAYRTATSGLSQIDPSLEESAQDLGSGIFRTFRTIILPLLGPAFMSALIFAFLSSVNTLSAVVFLITPDTNLATITILNLIEHGEWGQAAALSMIVLGIVFAVLGIFKATLGRSLKLFDI